jgi:hypothetical protein
MAIQTLSFLLLFSLLTIAQPWNTKYVSAPTGYVFNLGFPKSGSSSLYEYLRCRHQFHPSETSGVKKVAHYLCGRKDFMGSREYQTCGECVQRAVASAASQSSGNTPLPLNVSCSGALLFAQMDYANSTSCAFPQIENLEYLLQRHPEAKFLLLTRPVDRWLRSVHQFFDLKARLLACLRSKPHLFPRYKAMTREARREYMSGDSSGNGSDSSNGSYSGSDRGSGGSRVLEDWFLWHERHVAHLFRRRGEARRLLVLDIEGDLLTAQAALDAFLPLPTLTTTTTHTLPSSPAVSAPPRTQSTPSVSPARKSGPPPSTICWGRSNQSPPARTAP